MKKKLMLVNAAHPEEARVAIVEDGYLQELDIESSDRIQTKSNIYKGTITKVEASLQAAFVEYGSSRQGFLPLGEIHPDYWKKGTADTDPRKANIQDVLENKQSVLIQVVKEERGTKGAALTTYISLAGRYLVFSPNTTRIGISRKLSDEDRRSMKQILAELEVQFLQISVFVNAAHPEEARVAIVEDGYLQELDIESSDRIQTKSNIYKGTITKVEASLQAAFVEYGSSRQGFLPLGEIHPDYWKKGTADTDPRKANIQDVLENKQSVLIQVVKEERGTKGAALTTYISLAGRYLVFSPNTTRIGISRKLSDEDRRSMKQILAELEVPENMGLIVRTAGKDQTLTALQRDFSYLQRLWDEIRIKGESAPSPSFIYLDGDLATRAIRDHFSDDIDEIWVDKHDIYQRTKQFVHAVIPGKEKLVKLYRGKKPIFRHYGIEDQCEEIHEREVR